MDDWSPQEQARLAALSRYEPLREGVQEPFARLLQLASHTFRAPLSSLSLIDATHQKVAASCGLPLATLPRSVSMCEVVVVGGAVVSTGDAAHDHRFSTHPMVLGPPHLRFYASAPLRSPDGYIVGAFCVGSAQPRPDLTDAERDQLTGLAALAMDELELQLTAQVLQREQAALTHLNHELKTALRTAETLTAVAELADLNLTPQEIALHITELTASAMDVDWGGLMTLNEERAFSFGAWHSPRGAAFDKVASAGIRRDGKGLLWGSALASQPLFFDDYAGHGSAHPGGLALGLRAAASAPLGRLGETDYLMAFFRLDRLLPWSASDRRLITAVARAVRQTLQRAQARAALQEAQEQLRLTLDSAPLVLWATDLSGTITLSEGRGLMNLGIRPGQTVGVSIYDLYADSPGILANIDQAVHGQSLVAQVQAGPRVFEARYEPVRNAQGQQTGTLGLAYDVTALVQAEQRARQAQGHAEALLELSQLLVNSEDFFADARQALDTLRRALGAGWVVLWEGQDQTYERLIEIGEAPDAMREGQQGGPGNRDESLGVLGGRDVFLGVEDLSQDARRDGLRGVALLSLPLLPPERVWVLGLYRADAAFEHWSDEERQLLTAAARLLRAGAERHQQLTHLSQAAYTDSLTGLGNRRALDAVLPLVFTDAGRRGHTATLLSIDIDGLKRLNDTEGHARGDALLQTFAQALRDAFRTDDQLFRQGGDEFVVVMSHSQTLALPEERVRAAVRQTRAQGFSAVDASVGVACYPDDGLTPEAVLACSDERMYQVKGERRATR